MKWADTYFGSMISTSWNVVRREHYARGTPCPQSIWRPKHYASPMELMACSDRWHHEVAPERLSKIHGWRCGALR